MNKEDRVRELLLDIIPKKNKPKLLLNIEKIKFAKSCLTGFGFNKSMVGSGALWGYLPHFMDVKINGTSLRDKLSNPAVVEQIIHKTVKFCDTHEGGVISRNRVFQSLKAYNGHHVSNFRPVAARDLFLDLVGKNKFIFDPCAGWGGRMLGAIGSDSTYFGIDASIKTVRGLEEAISDMSATNVDIWHGAIEDMWFDTPIADIAFTSPPYYNTEIYSVDEEQSCNRYKTYEEWRTKFLLELCKRMRDSVCIGGFVCLNVNDVKKYPIRDDTTNALYSVGLSPYRYYKYIMSSISGRGIKYEPIYVFRRIE